MANTFFKSFSEADRTTSRTLLHESIPITGTLVSGTYSNNNNIKSFSHGMFKSVYDYPYLSSSANHLFDVTWGYVSSSEMNTQLEGLNIVSAVTNQTSKKKNIYSQMAQVLVGYDTNGNIRPFDFDGNHSGGQKMGTAAFINFSRLLVKDEIKKGSFSITLGTGSSFDAPFTGTFTLADHGAESTNGYLINSPAGEYGLLYTASTGGNPRGLIFYQAGVAVIPASSAVLGGAEATTEWVTSSAKVHRDDVMKTGSMNQFVDGLVHRIQNIEFNNTTELNSTIYFCRASHNEFNYSSNTTYLSGSKVQVKANDLMMPPRSYITTVGLYSADNELLAVAKMSEPLRKDPSSEVTLRVRLDY